MSRRRRESARRAALAQACGRPRSGGCAKFFLARPHHHPIFFGPRAPALCSRSARRCGFLPWGRSSVGRALEWHSRGQGFDSPRLHQYAGKARRARAGPFSLIDPTHYASGYSIFVISRVASPAGRRHVTVSPTRCPRSASANGDFTLMRPRAGSASVSPTRV